MDTPQVEETVVIEDQAVVQVAPAESTALGAVTPEPEVEYAFGIILPAWGEFQIVKSANAWWMDSRKVALLFDGYKAGATDEGACINANISLGQLRYFRETHPDFPRAKEACKSSGMAKFLNGLHTKGPDDLPTIRWYLARMHPDFKEKQEKVDPTAPVQQTVNVTGNAAIIQHVDTTKIEKLLEGVAERLLTEYTGTGNIPG